MAEKPFRVLLDLTDLQLDSFKYVWMNVSPQELKTISEFKTLILSKINLERVDINLFLRNGRLLDNETVMILREDDTVKVQYENQFCSNFNHSENSVKKSKKSSRKRNHSDSPGDLSSNIKRYKSGSKVSIQENEEFNIDDMNWKQGKKHKKSSGCSEISFHQPRSFEINDSNVKKISKKKDRKQKTLETYVNNLPEKTELFCSFDDPDKDCDPVIRNNTLAKNVNDKSSYPLKLDSTEDSSLIEQDKDKSIKISNNDIVLAESNSVPKKKRKRHRKHKKIVETAVIDTCDNTNINNQFKSFANDTNENIQRKHIIYSSSPNESEVTEWYYGKKEKLNSKTETFVLNESASNAALKPPVNHPKISTPAQSNFYENPNLCISLVQNMNLSSNSNGANEHVKEKCESFTQATPVTNLDISKESYKNKLISSFETHKNILDNSNKIQNENEKPSKLQYEDLPSLNSRPDIGTQIAYKVLELDAHYSPVISDYREGVVKSINVENDEIEIEFLKHEIKPGRRGKFENLKEDEIPLPEIKTCDIVCWSNVIEPKLLTS